MNFDAFLGGIQVKAGSAPALADAIRTLLENPAERERLALAGRKRIEETFCWQIAAREMTDFYYQMLDEGDGDS